MKMIRYCSQCVSEVVPGASAAGMWLGTGGGQWDWRVLEWHQVLASTSPRQANTHNKSLATVKPRSLYDESTRLFIGITLIAWCFLMTWHLTAQAGRLIQMFVIVSESLCQMSPVKVVCQNVIKFSCFFLISSQRCLTKVSSWQDLTATITVDG